MKIVIEKFVCDVCNKEMAAEQHYMITLGTSNSWGEDAEFDEQLIKKDLCHECYRTIAQLIGGKPIPEEEKPEEEQIQRAPDGRKIPYDKEIIKELWAKGLTYKMIAAKTGYKVDQVSYVISRCMSREERLALRSKYSTHTEIQEDNSVKMKVTTDAEGNVLSIGE